MDARRLTLIAVALGGVGAGVAATTFVGGGGSTRMDTALSMPQPGAAALAADDAEHLAHIVDSLVTLLDEEIRERNLMAEEIRELRAEVERLQGVSAIGSVAVANSAPVSAQAVELRRSRRVPQSQRERLLAAGFTERDTEAIERRAAEATMERMMLDDRALREGWANTPRYFEEMRTIESEQARIRNYLGDDAYDRYLFASGNPNRLSVASVVPTSPAEQAGLEPGDILLSYGDQRLFDNRQLRELRSAGQPGESVTVEVMRDGRAMEITIPRGPIGIQINTTIVNPEEGGPARE